MDYSAHAEKRLAHRNLSHESIDYIIRYGAEFHRAGALFYYLRSCDIPSWDRANDRYTRLVGAAVVYSADEAEVITIWRNRGSGLRRIRRKPGYTIPTASQTVFV